MQPLMLKLLQSLARSDHDRHMRPRASRTSGEAGGLDFSTGAAPTFSRPSMRKIHCLIITIEALGAATGGCADNDSALFIRSVLAPSPDDCKVTAQPDSEFLPFGIYDTALA